MVEQESGAHQPDRGRCRGGQPRDEAPGACGEACPDNAGHAVRLRRGKPAVRESGFREGRHTAERLFRGLVPPHPFLRGERFLRGTAQGAALAPA